MFQLLFRSHWDTLATPFFLLHDMDCATIDQLRKEIQRHLLGSCLGSTDNSRLSIDVISQNILHHWPNSPEKLSQFWEDLELNDRLLQRLITHDDAWVGRFFLCSKAGRKKILKKCWCHQALMEIGHSM